MGVMGTHEERCDNLRHFFMQRHFLRTWENPFWVPPITQQEWETLRDLNPIPEWQEEFGEERWAYLSGFASGWKEAKS